MNIRLYVVLVCLIGSILSGCGKVIDLDDTLSDSSLNSSVIDIYNQFNTVVDQQDSLSVGDTMVYKGISNKNDNAKDLKWSLRSLEEDSVGDLAVVSYDREKLLVSAIKEGKLHVSVSHSDEDTIQDEFVLSLIDSEEDSLGGDDSLTQEIPIVEETPIVEKKTVIFVDSDDSSDCIELEDSVNVEDEVIESSDAMTKDELIVLSSENDSFGISLPMMSYSDFSLDYITDLGDLLLIQVEDYYVMILLTENEFSQRVIQFYIIKELFQVDHITRHIEFVGEISVDGMDYSSDYSQVSSVLHTSQGMGDLSQISVVCSLREGDQLLGHRPDWLTSVISATE